MKNLFENWQKFLEEEQEEDVNESLPKVVCNCACVDCVFNQNEKCVDPVNEKGERGAIDLIWTRLEDGRYICECKTYQVGSGETAGPDAGQESEEEVYAESTAASTGPGEGPVVGPGAAKQYIDEM